MGRAANAVYAVLVEEAHAHGVTRAGLDALLSSAWDAPEDVPVDDAAALDAFMDGITMDDLLSET